MSSFRECCIAKYPLQPNDSAAYLVHRSNAAPGRAVCFLGRFLPKLGGAASTAIFSLGAAPGSRVRLNIARPMSLGPRVPCFPGAKRSPTFRPYPGRASGARRANSDLRVALVTANWWIDCKYADELDARAKALEDEPPKGDVPS
jgi:hypothetical protein